jgi:hypothetical protein
MANFFKTGVQTVAVLVVHACRVYDKYAPSFNAFIDASSLTSDEKSLVHTTMSAIGASCAVFRKLTKLA